MRGRHFLQQAPDSFDRSVREIERPLHARPVLGAGGYIGKQERPGPRSCGSCSPVDGAQSLQTCQGRKPFSRWLVRAGSPRWTEECLAFPLLAELCGDHGQPPDHPEDERPQVCRSLLGQRWLLSGKQCRPHASWEGRRAHAERAQGDAPFAPVRARALP